MLQLVPKWRIEVSLSNGQRPCIWISDVFLENALRKLADMSFTDDPMVRVVGVRVGAASTD